MRWSAVGCIMTLTLSFLVAPLAVDAQQPVKIPKIGFLSGGSARSYVAAEDTLLQGLQDLGYIEGQNLTIERRFAEEHLNRLPDLAAELVHLQVDIIVARAAAIGTQAAMQATSTIPIVMATGGTNPVENGLVASLAHPGGNVTGVCLALGEGFAGKWVELLKAAVPHVSRVAVLWNPASLSGPRLVRDVESAVRSVGLQLQLLEARGAHEFDSAFAAMRSEGVEALIVLSDAGFDRERKRIVDLVATSRLPAMYEHRRFVDAGGLMSYGPNLPVIVRRAAYYVDRILKGTKPADLPVELPLKLELVINLKTAEALGRTIPSTLLFQADEVIK
jgi:putative ABC transport system substrate-binding protein